MNKQIAKDLLDIGAVFLRPNEPFTWASGIKSPIYCDNRLVLSEPEVRGRIAQAMAETVRESFPGCQALFGTATAGIAHAAIAAYLLGMPMGYVRSGAKDHGRGNRIEGKLEPGQRVVVVEDLISTGSSALESAAALREAGADVLGVACIFTYGMAKGIKRFKEAGLRLEALTDFDTLIEVAASTGGIRGDDTPSLRAFRDNPDDVSWMMFML
ncbi:orotate phosphoribosyltransferase [Clostridia bacterium]|nr:orotate phosphoribosyltransferase [Clostridia bacterium]